MVVSLLLAFGAGFFISNILCYLSPEAFFARQTIESLKKDVEVWRDIAARNDAVCMQALAQLDRLTGARPSLFQRPRHLQIVEDD